MARPLRIAFPGAWCHVTSRGNEQKDVFKIRREREKFLEYLASATERYGAVIHCYCLMSNHYHLLLETPDGNLSQIMRHINGAYCKLVSCLSFMYTDFPETISKEKIKCLIREKTVELSTSTFEYVKEDKILLPMLLGHNIREYIANKKSYPISDNIRTNLLKYEMSTKQRVDICLDVTSDAILANRELANQIIELVALQDTDYSLFDSRIIASAIASAQQSDKSIQIIAKCIPGWDRNLIMETLAQLPAPYCDIAEFGKNQKSPIAPQTACLQIFW